MHMMEVSSAFISKPHSSSTDISRRPPATWEPEPGSVLDPFHIEDLLDFSNEDIAGPIGEELSAVTTERTVTQQHQSQSPAALEQPAANEFSIDCDEIPELEWLSSFVDDDSFGMGVFIGNKGQYSPVSNTSDNKKPEEHTNKRTHRMMLVEESSTKDTFQVGSPISVLESTSGRLANQAVPGRPRSKRARNSSNTSWNNTSSSCLLNSTTNGVSPATSSVSAEKEIVSDNAGSGSGSGSLDNNCCFEQDVVDSVPVLREQESSIVSISKMVNVSTPVRAGKPPLQVKPLQVRPAETGSDVQPRRCTHCLSQKTPQWRAGPEGPKTLCNACGVRYKSGRLFPEYRPALSPTFISDVHSNSHRKVLEMRRQKEMHQRQPSSSQEVIIDGGLIYTS